jgi:hypothetical protein
MLRFLMVASVIAVGCVAVSLPAEAQSRGFGTRGSDMDGRGGVHMQQTRPVTLSPNGVTSRQFNGHQRRPRHHHHFGPLVPFGFFDGFESPGAAAVAGPPASDFDALSAVPAQLDADRPPCQETTPQGTVIFRGTGCSRSAH